MTATFFNADYLVKQLPKGARLMLSGEVSYFRQAMQLTHPAFLVLDGSGQGKGSKSMAKIAEGSTSVRGHVGGLRARLLSHLRGECQGAEAGTSTRACVRCWPCSIPWTIHCRMTFGANGDLFQRMRRCVRFTSPNTSRSANGPAPGWRSTKRSDCSGRWWSVVTGS